MTDKDLDDILAPYLEAARRDAPVPGPDWTARVLADAAQARRPPVRKRTRPGIAAQLFDLLGRWPGIGGLATAGVAGLWIGLAPLSALPDPVGGVMGALAQDDPMALIEYDVAALLEEG